MRFEVTVTTRKQAGPVRTVIEVPDDDVTNADGELDSDKAEVACREAMFELIDWEWRRVPSEVEA